MTLQSTIDRVGDFNHSARPGDMIPIRSDYGINYYISDALIKLTNAQSPNEARSILRIVRRELGGRAEQFEPVLKAIFDRVQEVHNLKRLAGLDELTSIANRRSFNSALQRSTARCYRSGQSLALIMIDLDELKLLNDRFGHSAGDLALRKVAESCIKMVRASDLVARIGGDEFAILLPDIDCEGALTVVKRIRETVEKQSICGKQLAISAGLSIMQGQTYNKNKLIEHADAALYHDKRQRRAIIEPEAA